MYAEKPGTLFCLCGTPRSAGGAWQAGGFATPKLRARVTTGRRSPAGPAELGELRGCWDLGGSWGIRLKGKVKGGAERSGDPPPSGLSGRGRKGREEKTSPSREGSPGAPRPALPWSRRRDPGRVGPGGRALPRRKARAGGGLVRLLTRSLLLRRSRVWALERTPRAPSPATRARALGGGRTLRQQSSALRRGWAGREGGGSSGPRGAAQVPPGRAPPPRRAWRGSAPASPGRAWPALAVAAQTRGARRPDDATWTPR